MVVRSVARCRLKRGSFTWIRRGEKRLAKQALKLARAIERRKAKVMSEPERADGRLGSGAMGRSAAALNHA
jgi:hypothetical protein